MKVGLRRAVKRWGILMVLMMLFSPASAKARLLNLNGNLQANFNYSQSTSGGATSKSNSWGQRYNLGVSNPLFRFGIFRADGSWYSERLHTETAQGGASTFDQNRQLRVIDFRLMTSLFPRTSPLSVSYQQILRRNKVDTATDDTVRVLTANWINHFRGFPRMALSYNRSVFDSKSEGEDSNNTTNQSVTVQADGEIKTTQLSAGYQYSEADTNNFGTTTSQGLNFSANSKLTEALIGNAFGRYTTSKIPATFVVPGTQFFQERAVGVTLNYRPLLYWWDGNVGYGYSENPFVGGFKSNTFSGTANLRPARSLTFTTNGRIVRLSIQNNSTDSETISASVNYIPFFGLSTGGGTSFNHTLTSSPGSSDNTILSESFNYYARYNKTVRNLQYRTGYAINYGQSQRRTDGSDTWSLNNNFSAGVDNTNVQRIHLGSALSVNDLRSRAGGEYLKGTTVILTLTADSNYYRNLLRRGDRLTLKSVVTLSDNRGFGLEGYQETFTAFAGYAWVRIYATLDYSIENYPNSAMLDRQKVDSLLQYTVTFIRGMNLILKGKDSYEDNRYRADTNRVEGTADMTYQLGLISMKVTYIRTMTWIYGDNHSKTTLDSVSATISRPF